MIDTYYKNKIKAFKKIIRLTMTFIEVTGNNFIIHLVKVLFISI